MFLASPSGMVLARIVAGQPENLPVRMKLTGHTVVTVSPVTQVCNLPHRKIVFCGA
jgi:hypothetical protein